MRAIRSAGTTLGILLLLAGGAALAQQTPPSGRVAAVRVVNVAGVVIEETPSALALKPGQSLDAEAVRESLRQLYRSGRYADVRAETVSASDGLRVDFVVRENEFINLVRVFGLRNPQHENLALAALRLNLGEVFEQRNLEEALDRLRQVLQEIGFYEAQITPEVARHEHTRQVDILFRIEPGPRALLGEITWANPNEGPTADLLRRSKLRAGQRLSQQMLERGAERVRSFLFKNGHLGARVIPRRGEYDPQTHRVPIHLEVFAGPRIAVRVEGVKISQRQLRKLLPIYEEGAVDEDLLQEGRRDLRDFMETRGYFDSRVTYSRGSVTESGAQEIVYQITPGTRWRLAGFDFEGNRYFNDELLRARMRIVPAAALSRGRFSSRLLADDIESIRELYRANGFREVEVRAERQEDSHGRKGDLFIRFRIMEGPQTLVGELVVQGNSALSTEYLYAEAINSENGQPYSEFNVASDRDNVLAVYFNEGFPEARFEASAEPAAEPNRMRVTYRIVEGPQVRVRDILFGGEQFTRPNVIRREVQIQQGQPLRLGDVVESQRRLYNLGIFNRVQIAPQNPTGADTEKTVVVLVEEARRYTIAYGGGMEVQRLGSGNDPTAGDVRASPRGIFEVTKLNVGGRAHTLSFKARASTLQGRALLSYTAPNFLASPKLSFQLTGFADKTSDIRTFTSTRYEGSVQLAQMVTPMTSFLYRYSYRRVQVDAGSLKVNPAEIPLFSQPTKISSLGATWVRERRNNPAEATRGDFNTLDISVAPKGIGSSASFVRLFAQNSTFHPFGRDFVLARSTRFGVQKTFGGTQARDVPLPERFFAGGGNSLRGFGLNQAGPRDPVTGFPIGGLAMLLFNNELRFPMRLPLTRVRLGGAVFYDAGNVFSDIDRLTLRSKPPSLTDLNFFSHTIGFSLRYSTPIGPVRVDFGYLLNPARFEFTDANNVLRRDRLPRFQIFFNIGSMF